MAIDAVTRRAVIGNVQGGVSGPAIKPIALLKVKQVCEVAGPKRVPVIGQGGIASATDAIEFLVAGAAAVGIGTALFYDPLLCPKVNDGIAAYLQPSTDLHPITRTTSLPARPTDRLYVVARRPL